MDEITVELVATKDSVLCSQEVKIKKVEIEGVARLCRADVIDSDAGRLYVFYVEDFNYKRC